MPTEKLYSHEDLFTNNGLDKFSTTYARDYKDATAAITFRKYLRDLVQSSGLSCCAKVVHGSEITEETYVVSSEDKTVLILKQWSVPAPIRKINLVKNCKTLIDFNRSLDAIRIHINTPYGSGLSTFLKKVNQNADANLFLFDVDRMDDGLYFVYDSRILKHSIEIDVNF